MVKRGKQSKRLLAVMLSAAMAVLNVSTAVPVYAAPSADEFREDAELINDLGLSREQQRELQQRGTASPSDATAAAEAKQGEKAADILVGSSRWGYAVQRGESASHRIKRR